MLTPLARSNCLIAVGTSVVHGIGAFASQDLVAEQRVGVYGDRQLSVEDAASLVCTAGLIYTFARSDDQVVDGSEGGSSTRHINHSCEPNCVAREENAEDGSSIVTVHALRHIKVGEELSLDDSLIVDVADEHRYECRCRARQCRGTMVSFDAQALRHVLSTQTRAWISEQNRTPRKSYVHPKGKAAAEAAADDGNAFRFRFGNGLIEALTHCGQAGG